MKLSNSKGEDIRKFINSLSEKLSDIEDSSFPQTDLRKFKSINTNCVFTWNAASGEMNYKSGFYQLLGVEDEIVTLERFVAYIHPEDVEYVKIIGQAATMESVHRPEVR